MHETSLTDDSREIAMSLMFDGVSCFTVELLLYDLRYILVPRGNWDFAWTEVPADDSEWGDTPDRDLLASILRSPEFVAVLIVLDALPGQEDLEIDFYIQPLEEGAYYLAITPRRVPLWDPQFRAVVRRLADTEAKTGSLLAHPVQVRIGLEISHPDEGGSAVAQSVCRSLGDLECLFEAWLSRLSPSDHALP